MSAALMSTVLGPTVEFACIAGNVVTTRSAAVPGAVGLVLMAVLGALLVDGPHGLLDRTASLSPRPTNRDRRGDEDGPGGSEERPEDRGGHEGRPVTQTTKQSMQLLFSSPSRGHSGGPADAKIISAHPGKTDHAANGLRTRVDQGPQLGRAPLLQALRQEAHATRSVCCQAMPRLRLNTFSERLQRLEGGMREASRDSPAGRGAKAVEGTQRRG